MCNDTALQTKRVAFCLVACSIQDYSSLDRYALRDTQKLLGL